MWRARCARRVHFPTDVYRALNMPIHRDDTAPRVLVRPSTPPYSRTAHTSPPQPAVIPFARSPPPSTNTTAHAPTCPRRDIDRVPDAANTRGLVLGTIAARVTRSSSSSTRACAHIPHHAPRCARATIPRPHTAAHIHHHVRSAHSAPTVAPCPTTSDTARASDLYTVSPLPPLPPPIPMIAPRPPASPIPHRRHRHFHLPPPQPRTSRVAIAVAHAPPHTRAHDTSTRSRSSPDATNRTAATHAHTRVTTPARTRARSTSPIFGAIDLYGSRCTSPHTYERSPRAIDPINTA